MTRERPRRRPSRNDTTAAWSVRALPKPLEVVLRVQGAAAAPTELRLSSGSCVVGAGSDVDVVVQDQAVSRRHVELELVAEGVAVRDLDSRNGTYYLGQRLERMVLRPGSRIRVGNAEIQIDIDRDALERLDSDAQAYLGLVGNAPAMRKLFAVLTRLEGSLVSVLIEGASGVGKELVARAIHRGSARSDLPLVTVNCGALSRELVLSELFGHVRGAFTGATDARAGAFEIADGGTLFLDEVAELPLDVQPVLLRALESGEIKRIGDSAARHVNVRVLAATNRDMEAMVEAGDFREDLYFRLAVVKLRVPALHERQEDVTLLARHFAGGAELPDDVMTELGSRRFRGNARELKNAVLAYLALGALPDGPARQSGVLEAALKQTVDPRQPYQEQKEALGEVFSRIYFDALLDLAGGNQSEAARIAGMDRSYLRKLLRKYGVD